MYGQEICSDYGLPSFDHDCLFIMTYCAFSDIPVTLVNGPRPLKTLMTTSLPRLSYSDESSTGSAQILEALNKDYVLGTDLDLAGKQSADVIAFRCMIEEKLAPAILHHWWLEERVYRRVTSGWIASSVTCATSGRWLLAPLMARHVRQRLLRLSDASLEERHNQLYKEAHECLNYLASKLGTKDYFFGQTPTSLDAMVFGYLAPLLKATLPFSSLHNHLLGSPNLCKFINNICDKHFPLSHEETAALRSRVAAERSELSSSSVELPQTTRNYITAAILATAAMTTYAYMTGVIGDRKKKVS